jgi:hypothetical protein
MMFATWNFSIAVTFLRRRKVEITCDLPKSTLMESLEFPQIDGHVNEPGVASVG